MGSFVLKSGEQLTIRTALASDAAKIIAYVKQVADESSFLTFEGKDFIKTEKEEAAIIEDHLNSPNKLFIIGEINGKIVSILNAGGKPKPRLRHVIEFGVTVKKEFWNLSIGRHMIQFLIDWAKAREDVLKINLMVVEHNVSAIRLYENLGFEHEGRLRKDFFYEGKYYDGIAMGMLV